MTICSHHNRSQQPRTIYNTKKATDSHIVFFSIITQQSTEYIRIEVDYYNNFFTSYQLKAHYLIRSKMLARRLQQLSALVLGE